MSLEKLRIPTTRTTGQHSTFSIKILSAKEYRRYSDIVWTSCTEPAEYPPNV